MPIFYVGQTDYITQLNILASTALLPIVTDNSGKFLTTDGFITSWESLPAPYSLPTASTTTLGGVKIDGTTITISNGVISGFNGSFANLTNKPTTLAGYGITDSLTATSINTAIGVETTRATAAEALKAPIASPTFTGIPLSTTATSGTNTTQIATTAFVQTAVSNLVASAPAALDTLNELATALGNDANFATSVSTAIGLKAPIASPTFTGIPLSTTATSGTNTTQIATTAFVQTAVSNLVASAPAALDTLNELATALGNDANFATSVSTAIGLKAPIASPTFTGTATIPTLNLTNALGVAYGGTGLTTAPANGALDIGNGTGFTRTTLTAGSGITITNAAGNITIAATFSGSSTVAGSNTQIQFNNSGVFGASANLTWDGSKVTASAYQTGGNLTFTGTDNRITGDFSNATLASRVAFQTSTVNGNTTVNAIPNGTATSSQFITHNATDPGNSSRAGFNVGSTTALFFSDLTGTGTYLPMAFNTGGSERMRLDTSGNLGIGTSSPSTYSSVYKTVNAIKINDQVTTIGSYYQAGVDQYGFINVSFANGTTATSLVFSNGSNVERMRIDSSGNVGIGTNAPVSKLQVTNSLAITAANGYQFLLMGNQDSSGTNKPTIIRSANAGLQFGIGDSWSSSTGGTFTPYLNIGSTGNVGIGTNAPAYPLDVYSAANGIVRVKGGSGTSQGAAFYVTAAGSVNTLMAMGDSARIIGGTVDTTAMLYANVPLAFHVNNAERMRIDSSGKVLVNITTARSNIVGGSPQVQVEGTNAYTSSFSATRNESNGPAYLFLNSTGGTVNGSNTIVPTGSPLGKIAFSGADGTNISLGAIISGENDGTPGAGSMPGRLVFLTSASGSINPTERMRIDSSGRVGIGTSSPSTYVSGGGLALQGTYGTSSAAFSIYNSSGASASNIAKIDFKFNNTFSNDSPSAAIWALNPNAAGNNGGALVLATSANGTNTTPAEAMRIASSGNVGIGTNAPATKLHVAGDITGVGDLTLYRSGAPTTGYIYWGNTGTKYMGFDGSNIVASVSPAFSITGNAATATTTTNWGTYGAVPAAGSNASTANTIPRSDANGYSYFGYINSNTANSEAVTVSQVIVTNGSDNFYRKVSIANLTGFVQSNASGSWGINITGNAGSATTAGKTSATTVPASTAFSKWMFATSSTSGTLDWNDASNTIPGVGPTLLLGSATNGPSGGNYYHPFNIEYADINGTGNVTQMAIAYGSPGNELYMRGRYSGGWSSWTRFLNSGNYNSYSPTLTGTGASGNWSINAAALQGLTTGASGSIYTDVNWSYLIQGFTTGGAFGWRATSATSVAFSCTAAGAFSATTYNGFTPSATSGTTNRLVATDANGYIFNNYFNSTDNAISSGVTAIMSKQGDNYYRSASAAAVATFISGQSFNTTGTATGLNGSNYITSTGSSGNYNTDFQNTPAYTLRYNGDSANITNSPGGTWWFIENMRHSNSSNHWGTQIAWGWEDNANRLATRNVQAGSFGGWVYYLNSNNYNSYAPTLTGGGASGTWGINISGNAATVTGGITTSNYTTYAVKRTGNIGNGDLNSATYYNGSQVLGYNTATNRPGGEYGTMISINERTDTCLQMVVDYSTGFLYTRGIYTGGPTFSAWQTQLSSGNYNSYAPTLTGGGASGTWGINISGNAANITAYTVNQSVGTGNAPTFYGVYSNNWFRSNNATGWYNETYAVGIWATEASNVRTYNNANFIAGGNVTAYSDERVKTNWRNLAPDFIKNLSELKSGIYDRTDTELTQVGVGAQSLQKFLPEAILVHGEGELSVAYGNAAMVSAVELAKRIVEQEARIARLEALVSKLIKE